jgi:hypothetical protein
MPVEVGLLFESRGSGSTVSSGGGSFSVSFKPPMFIPREARNCTVSLINSRIWNNFPNVSALQGNNKFRYYDSSTWYEVTFDDGLYTIEDLEAEVQRAVVTNGGTADDITFDPEFSTGFLNIVMTTGWKIDWTNDGGNDTFRTLLGFTTTDEITSTGVANPIKGDVVGNFSAVSSVEVHSSFGKASINGVLSDVLDSFPLTAKPSFLNFYQALHPIKTDASHLIGTMINDVYFRLTDQNGNELEVPDNYGLTIVISYDM